MSPALWLLIRLQLVAWLRYLVRSVRTIKGALLALIGLGVVLSWLLSALLLPSSGQGYSLEGIRRYGPALILAYCLLNLVRSGERAVYFTPAEINFLFSGPFSRRQLLGYKVVYSLLLGIPWALLMSCFVRVSTSWFLAAYLALFLIFLFMQLFDMVLNLLVSAVGARLYSRTRQLLFIAFLGAGAAMLGSSSLFSREVPVADRLGSVLESTAWQAAVLPLRPFVEVFTARRWDELLFWTAAAALVNLALVGFIFVLDWQFLEASAAASTRIYERIRRVRQGGVSSGGSPWAVSLKVSLPMLPSLGGIGPIVWRQILTAYRGLGRLLLVVVAIACMFIPLLTSLERSDRQSEALAPTLISLMVWATVLMTAVVPFDFRGDIERIAHLKTLPIPGWRMVIGQLLTPTLLITSAEWLAMAGLVAFVPNSRQMALACAVHAPGLNFFLFALDNLLFLLFPTRLAASSPGDFQAMGRNVLGTLARLIGLVLLATGGAVVGLVVWLVTNHNLPAAIVAPLPLVWMADAALIPLVAMVFRGYDVSRDIPS